MGILHIICTIIDIQHWEIQGTVLWLWGALDWTTVDFGEMSTEDMKIDTGICSSTPPRTYKEWIFHDISLQFTEYVEYIWVVKIRYPKIMDGY